MKKAIVTFLMLLSVSLMACSEKSMGHSQSTNRSNPSPVPSQQHDYVPQDKFDFNKMMYTEQGTCGDKSGIYFKYLLTEDTMVGKSDRGNDLLAEVRVVLTPDRKFVAQYKEKEIESYTANGYTHKRNKARIVSGYWTIDNHTLILGDLLKINARMEEGRVKATATFLRDVVTSGVAGMTVKGAMVWSTSPGTKSYREVCPKAENQLGNFSAFASRSELESIKMSSLQLMQGQQFQAGSFYVNDLQLFLHKNGDFHLLINGVDMTDPNYQLKHYVVEDSYWERTSSNKLNFYVGGLLKKANGGAQLCITKDLWHVAPKGEILDFPMQGRCIDLEFRASNYNLDDLTSNYR